MANEPEVCIPNIGPKERQKRLRAGVVVLAVSMVMLAALILSHVKRWWRLALFLPLWVSVSGFFQARERT